MEQKEKTVLEKITGILSYLGYLSVVILLVLHLTRRKDTLSHDAL